MTWYMFYLRSTAVHDDMVYVPIYADFPNFRRREHQPESLQNELVTVTSIGGSIAIGLLPQYDLHIRILTACRVYSMALAIQNQSSPVQSRVLLRAGSARKIRAGTTKCSSCTPCTNSECFFGGETSCCPHLPGNS